MNEPLVSELPLSLAYDDVLLVPRRSGVASRREVDTSTKLSRHLTLQIPIVSANMDTVTESEMSIVLAKEGGIGIIHRFMSMDRQVAEVRKVKRAASFVVEHPYTIVADRPLRDASDEMRRHRVSGLLVVDKGGKLVGIVTARDLRFEDDFDQPIRAVMSVDPVTAPVGTDLAQAREILRRRRIEKLPLVDGDSKPVGLVTSRDILDQTRFPLAAKDEKGHLVVGAAIGIRGDYLDRAQALVSAGVDVLVIDVAHGHSEGVLAAIRSVRESVGPVELIAGNVATAEGTFDLIAAGVDAVKVGVGPGSICTTRIVSGSGVPQLSAVMECAAAARSSGVPIIADGGIRAAGDIAKAMAAGAGSVMIGSLLAGTDEAPGQTVLRNGGRFKITRGMASLSATIDRFDGESDIEEIVSFNRVVPEGVEALVPYKGKAEDILFQLVGGLRSGMSYSGAHSLDELRRNARFVRVTGAGRAESLPHDVEIVQ